MANYVYDILLQQGQQYDIKDAGYYCIESMRIEKGYRAWSHELKTDITPIEAGLAFTIDWKKTDFIGKSYLLN